MLRKLWALLKKDFLIEISYRLAFFFSLFSTLVWLFTYYFIDRLFGHQLTPYLQEYDISYFSYVLISLALFSYVGVGIGSFSHRIRLEQMQGTFEALIMTPTSATTLLLGMTIWNLLLATINVILYICAGIFLFNVSFARANLLSVGVIMALTVLSFGSLGIISAAFTIVHKRGSPIGWILNTLEGMLGGVYFPVNVLPGFLKGCAQLLPITHAIQALQLAVYQNYSLRQLQRPLTILIVLTLCVMPLSLWLFKKAVNTARKNGTLVHY